MSAGNDDQIAEWNGPLGQKWADMRREIEGIVSVFGDQAIKAGAPSVGERVVDIGCGSGAATRELARRVGPAGRAYGVDVSRPMLQAAREDAAVMKDLAPEFREGDAASDPLPEDIDLVFSRFGVMFFAEPATAFARIRTVMKPDGRIAFACWRAPRDNPWAMAPLSAARAALGIEQPPADPLAPGPFAFASDDRLRSILADAGFSDIRLDRFDALVHLGPSPAEAAANCLRIGPVGRLLRELGEDYAPAIADAVEAALTAHATPDAGVRLQGSTWIATARA